MSVVLSVDLASWGLAFNAESSVANLGGEAINKIKETCLADVLDLGASLADYGGLESHAGARVPTENGEWTCTGATSATKLLF